MKPRNHFVLFILAVFFLLISPSAFCFVDHEQAPQEHALFVKKSVLEKSAYSEKILPNVGEGAVSDTNPTLIPLSDSDNTKYDASLIYELLPAEYPYMNLYLDIYENDSRLFYSGATSENEITIPQGTLFEWENIYKAQLVVNKYYCGDTEIKFDVEDEDPDVNEVKRLDFIKQDWVDLEGNVANYATGTDPQNLEPYDHEPYEPGGEGGPGGPPEGSTFEYLVRPVLLENVVIDMTPSPQTMALDLICTVSDYNEPYTLLRDGAGAFMDVDESLSITLTDKPTGDDVEFEQLTALVIAPIFGYMSSMELYETGIDTNTFRTRLLEMVIDMNQYYATDTIEFTLTNNLFDGVVITETLTKSSDTPLTFSGPGDLTVVFDLYSGDDPTKPDDIRAMVNYPTFSLTNSYVDAIETANESMIFRTDALHNQGIPAGDAFDPRPSFRKVKSLVKDEAFKEDSVDVDLYLESGDGSVSIQLPETEHQLTIQKNDGFWDSLWGANARYIKNQDGIDVTFFAKELQENETRSLVWKEETKDPQVVIAAKPSDKLQIVKMKGSDKEVLSELLIFKADLDAYKIIHNKPPDADKELPDNEEENPGAFVPFNIDDDDYSADPNDNDPADLLGYDHIQNGDEGSVVNGDDDLLPIEIKPIEPKSLGGKYSFNIGKLEKVRIWNEDKTEQITDDYKFDATSEDPMIMTFYVEGIATGNETITLNWYDEKTEETTEDCDKIKITIFEMKGPLNVPGYSVLRYTASGVNGKFVNADNGDIVMGDNTPNCKIRWKNLPQVGKAIFEINEHYFWDLQVNVVMIGINYSQISTMQQLGQGTLGGEFLPMIYSNENFTSGYRAARAKITIDIIPPDVPEGSNNYRGAKFVKAGFIQNVTMPAYNSEFQSCGKIHKHYLQDGGYYLDAVDEEHKPWYRKDTYRSYLEDTVAQKTIKFDDAPRADGTDVWEIDDNGTPCSCTKFNLIMDFNLYFAVNSIQDIFDTHKTFTKIAESKWRFDGSGIIQVTSHEWTQTGIGNKIIYPEDTNNNDEENFEKVINGSIVPIVEGETFNNLLNIPNWIEIE